jgi:hypothetical protein
MKRNSLWHCAAAGVMAAAHCPAPARQVQATNWTRVYEAKVDRTGTRAGEGLKVSIASGSQFTFDKHDMAEFLLAFDCP